MNEKDFLTKLTEMLDCEETLSMETQLDNVDEWDSLGILSFLAEMGGQASTPVLAKDVRAAKKVKDLFALIR